MDIIFERNNITDFSQTDIKNTPLPEYQKTYTDYGNIRYNKFSSNNKIYEGLVNIKYTDTVNFKYMDYYNSLGSYEYIPYKAYPGQGDYYLDYVAVTVCYITQEGNYKYVCEMYKSKDNLYNLENTPRYTTDIIELNREVDFIETRMDSKSGLAIVIYKIDGIITCNKIWEQCVEVVSTDDMGNIFIKNIIQKGNKILYHCSSNTNNNFILDISTTDNLETSLKIIDLDLRIKNISFCKVWNGVTDGLCVSVDSRYIYLLDSESFSISKEIYFLEFMSSNYIPDITETTKVFTNKSNTIFWIQTSTKVYVVKKMKYSEIPDVDILQLAMDLGKKMSDYFYFYLGYDTNSNDKIMFKIDTVQKETDIYTEIIYNYYGKYTKEFNYKPTALIESRDMFSSVSINTNTSTITIRPTQYRYSNIYTKQYTPIIDNLVGNYKNPFLNISNIGLTSLNVDMIPTTTTNLIKNDNSEGLFLYSGQKTIHINNFKLK